MVATSPRAGGQADAGNSRVAGGTLRGHIFVNRERQMVEETKDSLDLTVDFFPCKNTLFRSWPLHS